MLGKVVIDDQHALALGHKIFGQCGAGIRGNVLQGGAVAGGSGHNGGVAHSAMLFQVLGHAGNGGSLLPDGNVDAEHTGIFLVQDGIGGDGGLAGLAVANDQLTLATADGEH